MAGIDVCASLGNAADISERATRLSISLGLRLLAVYGSLKEDEGDTRLR